MAMMGVVDSLEGLQPGSRIWVRSDSNSGRWAPALLRSTPVPGETLAVQLLDGSEKQVHVGQVQPANPTFLDGTSDLCQLSYLNEPSVLSVLEQRYNEDKIYTFAGSVLIALNPCKPVQLYTPEIASAYQGGARRDLQYASMPMCEDPHIFLVAAEAFRALVREGTNQSLVVSGESGAGKTETAKKAMQFFTTLAGGTGMEEQILQTNPILEAFGNAKTSRNHNSSRFGKLIDIQFNHTHHICGAGIRTYLLEKSRVVRQLPGERNYHIFYQLVAGATKAEREAWSLPDSATAFRYLNCGNCTIIPGVDDAAELQAVREGLSRVGIAEDVQQQVFEVVAGILWLGEVEFTAPDEDNTVVVESAAFANASRLLGVTPEALNRALTKREIRARDATVVKNCSMSETLEGRDALAKAIYAGLFNWIVDRINTSLASGKRSSGLTISVLDIFGFEDFPGANSFEQLCINYTNERLQQQFNAQLFTRQQQEYADEGISYVQVDFEDNGPAVELIDQRPPGALGILQLLDAQCRFPRATDEQFMHNLKQQLPRPRLSLNPRHNMEFTVTHFAGEVAYQAGGMLDKNKDTISTDLVELLASSSQALVGTLGKTLLDNAQQARMTVGLKFSEQLRELVAHLDGTGLHFIRCIKPNPQLKPDSFQPGMTLVQLRCCGVLEVVRMAKGGFPSRMAFKAFVDRYCVLLPGLENLREGETLRDAALRLLDAFKVQPDQYLNGRTKIFFRPGVLGQIDDRWASFMRIANKLQTSVRCWRWRTWFLKERRAAVAAQSAARGVLARRQLRQLAAAALEAKRHKAAAKIQRAWRGGRIRSTFREVMKAMVAVSQAIREEAKARKREEKERLAREEAAAAAAAAAAGEPQQPRKLMHQATSLHEVAADFGIDFSEAMSVLQQFAQQKAATGAAAHEAVPSTPPQEPNHVNGAPHTAAAQMPAAVANDEVAKLKWENAALKVTRQLQPSRPAGEAAAAAPGTPPAPSTPPPLEVVYPGGMDPLAVISEQNARMAALTAQVEVLVNAMAKMQQMQLMQAQAGALAAPAPTDVAVAAMPAHTAAPGLPAPRPAPATPASPPPPPAAKSEQQQQADNKGMVKSFMSWLGNKLPWQH